MAPTRWSVDKWHDLFRMLFRPEHVAFFPHKVFRWNSDGIYQDCFYPFQCEHLLGGEAIIGQSVRKVLPKGSGVSMQKSIRLALRRELPQDVQCVLPAKNQCYVASIRLFPYDSEVLGFVTDHDLSGKPAIQVYPGHPSLRFLKDRSGLSQSTICDLLTKPPRS